MSSDGPKTLPVAGYLLTGNHENPVAQRTGFARTQQGAFNVTGLWPKGVKAVHEPVVLKADAEARIADLTRQLSEVTRERDALRAAPCPLSDERIDFIADITARGMPGGIRGICKTWGWRQFAKALLEDCGVRAAPQPAEAKPPRLEHADNELDGDDIPD